VSEISEKLSLRMSSAASLDEASDLLRRAAGDRRAGESLKSVLRRVGRDLKGWRPSRVRAVWYRDKRVRIRAEEIEQIRALGPASNKIEIDRDEFAELRATVERLAGYETLLQRIDAEFFGPEISAARDQAGEARGLLGAGGVRRGPEA
jgi:hypothetical protein